jgi:hypothetical protein
VPRVTASLSQSLIPCSVTGPNRSRQPGRPQQLHPGCCVSACQARRPTPAQAAIATCRARQPSRITSGSTTWAFEGGHRLARGGPAGLRHAWQGRQLPDRSQLLRGHRHRVLPAFLAAVPSGVDPQRHEGRGHRPAGALPPGDLLGGVVAGGQHVLAEPVRAFSVARMWCGPSPE